MPTQNDQDVRGGCYCGAVRFLIAAGTEPYWAGYCHCRDCRQAHAAPVYQYVYVKEYSFRISDGAHLLKRFTRVESRRDVFKRYFCERCGSKIYNSLVFSKDGIDIDLRGTFPSLFDNQEIATSVIWSPKEHVYCGESIMNLSLLHDDIPRFLDQGL